ncbi:hypothetical protein FSP39_006802 [Pinctada imbricata]|uniref:CCHC-type domain-containing protein n=1 Tax=Pinctada imbricata TaxID=66713 RepID=A0AA88YKY4_PINIB|nr:hypothetical protein FSP39_006802 [Pinctada imbricata]
MAANTPSYADIVNMTETSVRRTEKPVFIKEIDIFGTYKVPKDFWLSHVEIYKAISDVIPAEQIAGIQRVRGLWRIYVDDASSRSALLTKGFSIRNKSVTLYSSNPNRPYIDSVDTTMIHIKNVPLSADDGQIKRALSIRNCEIVNLFREKIRVDGRLTNCENGDRIAIVANLAEPLPVSMEIGRYRAIIRHKGQPNENQKCTKCLQEGHVSRDCTNNQVCRSCNEEGHIAANCPKPLMEDTSESDIDFGTSDESDTDESGQDTTTEEAPATVTSVAADDAPSVNNNSESDQSSKSTEIRKTKAVPVPVTPSSLPRHKNKQHKNKKEKKDKTKSEQSGPMEKFLKACSSTKPSAMSKFNDTPSRKSSSIPPDIRSPLSPAEERNKTAKKANTLQKDKT